MEEAFPLCLCHICLRVDRPTRILGQTLANFMHILCNTAVERDTTAQFCSECEYQLSEFHKFKVKCVGAATMLHHLKRTRVADRKPYDALYKLLPELNLHNDVIKQKSLVNVSSVYETPGNLQVKDETNAGHSKIFDTNKKEPKMSLKDSESDENAVANDKKELKDSLITSTSEIVIKLEKFEIEYPEPFQYDEEKSLISVNEKFAVNKNYSADYDDVDDVEKIEIDYPEPFQYDEEKSVISVNEKFAVNKNYSADDDDVDQSDKSNINASSEISLNDGDDAELDDARNDKEKRKRCPLIFEEDHSDISDSDTDVEEFSIPAKKSKQTHSPSEATHIDSANESGNKKRIKKYDRMNYLIKKMNTPFCMEKLKINMSNMFANCDKVKAADGTVIERDVILNNLENWPVNMLREMWKYILADPEKFNPNALKILARYQKRFDDKLNTVFEVEYFKSKEQAIEEFLKRKTYTNYVGAAFKCEICFQGFKTAKGLKNHHKRHHDPSSAGNFECEVCRMRVRSAAALWAHSNQVHRAVFRCRLCPLITYYRYGMTLHSDQHLENQHKCGTCQAPFKCRTRLRNHVYKYHKTELICEFCAGSFTTPGGLNLHRRKNHKDEVYSEQGVACDACNVTFVSLDVYEKHRRLTHGDIVKRKKPRKPDARKERTNTRRVCAPTGSRQWKGGQMRAEHVGAALAPAPPRPERCVCGTRGRGFTKNKDNTRYQCELCLTVLHARSLKRHLRPRRPAALAGGPGPQRTERTQQAPSGNR